MNRVDIVKGFTDDKPSDVSRALFRAMICCLTPEEACRAIDVAFAQNFYYRNSLLTKIADDMRGAYRSYHGKVITQFIHALSTFRGSEQSSCGYCLEILYSSAPRKVKRRIFEALITSRYLVTRRRAYKLLKSEKEDVVLRDYRLLIEMAWDKYRDGACASTIVNVFPTDYLFAHFDELRIVLEDWSYRRLFLKC